MAIEQKLEKNCSVCIKYHLYSIHVRPRDLKIQIIEPKHFLFLQRYFFRRIFVVKYPSWFRVAATFSVFFCLINEEQRRKGGFNKAKVFLNCSWVSAVHFADSTTSLEGSTYVADMLDMFICILNKFIDKLNMFICMLNMFIDMINKSIDMLN